MAAGTRFTILEDWSPDSKELLIAATVPTGTFLAAIAVSDATRREIAPIAPYGTSGRPEAAWSPDGSSVAFTDDCEDVCQSLRVVTTQRGQPRDLHIAGSSVAEPLWVSRPGTLVYAEERNAGRVEVTSIYLVDTRTGRRRRLGPRYGAAGASLTASEDRARIAALYLRHGLRLDVVDIATNKIRHYPLHNACVAHGCSIWIAGAAS